MKVIIYILGVFYLLSCNSPTSSPTNRTTVELPAVSLEESGINSDSIDVLLNLIEETSSKDFRGLVVIKEGNIVIEEYFNTFWRNSILDIRSAGKSVTALLLGVAMREGLVDHLDQDIHSFFSEENNSSLNPEYRNITLRQILDMSSGVDADSDDGNTIGHAGKWIARDDWKDYILSVPLVAVPGEKFVYSDIHPLLIGLAIEEASGMSLKDYAQEKLFDPLGIHQVYWYTNIAGQTGAAGNLYLSTLDFAKLGMLITNDGSWGDEQIIDKDYIEALINSRDYEISDWFSLADSYGMFWYKANRTFKGKEYDLIFASGNGGNLLIVFPEQEMVIALTSSAYGQGYPHGRAFAIVEKIMNALR